MASGAVAATGRDPRRVSCRQDDHHHSGDGQARHDGTSCEPQGSAQQVALLTSVRPPPAIAVAAIHAEHSVSPPNFGSPANLAIRGG